VPAAPLRPSRGEPRAVAAGAAAQQSIRSEGLVMQLSFDAEGRSGGVAMQGGAQLKGANVLKDVNRPVDFTTP
jgi:hypothetical protein